MRKHLLVVAWTILATATAALAGDLVTPETYVGSSVNAYCTLLNVSTSPITAQVQVYGTKHGLLSDSGVWTIAPGEDLDADPVFGPEERIYCRFVRASKSKTRGSLHTWRFSDLTDEIVLPAN